jgi:large subunit ribosomal protein L4
MATTLEIKSKEGKAVGKYNLSDAIASASASATTIHRAVVAEEANSRQGTQKTKTRSETRGGGRKPYRQKKTGRARQGSIRAPHYTHGGMALALEPRDYEKKINRRERRAAILAALADKIASGDLAVTDSIEFTAPKTKDASSLLKAFGLDEVRRVLVVLPKYDETAYRSFRNLPNVVVRTAPSSGNGENAEKTVAFSARDLMVAHKVLVTKEALERIEAVWAPKEARK